MNPLLRSCRCMLSNDHICECFIGRGNCFLVAYFYVYLFLSIGLCSDVMEIPSMIVVLGTVKANIKKKKYSQSYADLSENVFISAGEINPLYDDVKRYKISNCTIFTRTVICWKETFCSPIPPQKT